MYNNVSRLVSLLTVYKLVLLLDTTNSSRFKLNVKSRSEIVCIPWRNIQVSVFYTIQVIWPSNCMDRHWQNTFYCFIYGQNHKVWGLLWELVMSWCVICDTYRGYKGLPINFVIGRSACFTYCVKMKLWRTVHDNRRSRNP